MRSNAAAQGQPPMASVGHVLLQGPIPCSICANILGSLAGGVGPIQTPKYFDPDYGDPQKGTPTFENPPVYFEATFTI